MKRKTYDEGRAPHPVCTRDDKAEFGDVLTDSYYANAVAWAVENGVTNGIGDGLFGPNNSCTRAQIVTFLFRAYQGK